MTTLNLAPALDMAEPVPEFPCDTRERALATLTRIARSTGKDPDVSRKGAYTRWLPGVLALIYDDPHREARLYSTTVDGRLACLEAIATWEAANG